MHRFISPTRHCVVAAIFAAACVPVADAHAQVDAGDERARAIVHRGIEAMGGEVALRDIKATRLEFHSAVMSLGQEHQPGGLPTFNTRVGTIIRDFVGARVVTTGEQHTALFRATYGFQLQPYFAIATHSNGAERIGATWVQQGPNWGSREAGALRLTPEKVLLTALDAPCRLERSSRTSQDAKSRWDVRCGNGAAEVALAFDPLTGLLRRYAFTSDLRHRVAAEMRVTVDEFHPVAEPGANPLQPGVRRILLPHAMRIEYDGELLTATHFGRIELLPQQNDSAFAVPDSLRARASQDPLEEPPVITQVADDVFRLAFGPYVSVAIIQRGSRGDSIVVLDLPDTPARTRAMLDTLRARFPKAPVRLIVNSHAHADHANGAVAAFEARIPVLTHRGNVAFLSRIDSMTRGARGRPAAIRGVADSVTIGSGSSALKLWALPTREATTFLVGYLPAWKTLWAPDIAEGSRAGPEVRRVVSLLRVDVDRVVPGHTLPYSWSP